jgi:hypothetical protein
MSVTRVRFPSPAPSSHENLQQQYLPLMAEEKNIPPFQNFFANPKRG